MIRDWARGRRALGSEYAEIFTETFGVPFSTETPAAVSESTGIDLNAELAARLTSSAALDASLIKLFEDQTSSFRVQDRQLGASRLMQQTEAHVAQMTDLLEYSLPGALRTALAAAVAEAAALAGWQALDLGDPGKTWAMHEKAKSAARESEEPSIIAHVTAQQAYALLDLDRAPEAVNLIQHARQEAADRVPSLLRSWLWAAEAEALASAREPDAARVALDSAAQFLPSGGPDETLPFLFLSDVHLARWRGHCLARLGMSEAVDDLSVAVKSLDPSFTRATAGLRCDLALAYSVRGQHHEARAEARMADELATRTSSVRQRRRINRLLQSGTAHSGR
ncbi:XRE family transcriptional regulator [Couchioplanes caeruleus]|nr:XRE family transcriptional regulator [Couchioplanes caeruleus]